MEWDRGKGGLGEIASSIGERGVGPGDGKVRRDCE